MKNDPIARLYAVATDDEAATLDNLRERAGLTWECRGPDGYSHWTNAGSARKCERCGRPRPRLVAQ